MNEFFKLLLGSFFLLLWFTITLIFFITLLPAALLSEIRGWDAWFEIKDQLFVLLKGRGL